MEEADLTRNLPEALLAAIVSFLPGMEGVRTSVVSQRWKTAWKYSSHLGFDQKQMKNPSVHVYLQSSNRNSRLSKAMSRKLFPGAQEFVDEIAESSMLIRSIIDAHIGPLKSCSIRHLPESCASSEAVGWMMKLLDKDVRKVSMVLEPPDYSNPRKKARLAFKQHASTLNLPSEMLFEVPKLQFLCSYNHMKRADNSFLDGKKVLTTSDIIEIFTGILGPQASSMSTIFKNLVALYIDIDLKYIRNIVALSFGLKSCHHLKNLEINNQVNDDLLNCGGLVYDENEDDCLPYPKNLFWQTRELCECVNRQLKYLCIKGYTGKELEMEFVKYMITNAKAMESITLWFVDHCLWFDVTATMCLLSYPKASRKLSIDLKPGTSYLKKEGRNFQKWVTTLKL